MDAHNHTFSGRLAYWKKKSRNRELQNLFDSQLADEHSDLSKAFNAEHDDYIMQSLFGKAIKRYGAEAFEIFRLRMHQNVSYDILAEQYKYKKSSVRSLVARILSFLRFEAEGLVDST